MAVDQSFCPSKPGFQPCDDRRLCERRRLCRHVQVAPIDFIIDGVKPCVHFVGFRPAKNLQQWVNAVRVFGEPDIIHYTWDQRAQREIAVGWDTVVFATGSEDQSPSPFNFDDSNEPDDPAALERPYRPTGRWRTNE